MNMTGVSLLGWVHTAACTIALLAGAYVLVWEKGTARHKQMGRIYVYSLFVACIAIFGVYHFDIRFSPFKAGPGIFGLFHYENVAALAALLLAFFAASRQNRAFFAYAHPVAMLFTYYMLLGGLINELFVRVAPLRALAGATLPPGARNPAQSAIVGTAQLAAMLWFLGAIVWFAMKVARSRRKPGAAAAMAAE